MNNRNLVALVAALLGALAGCDPHPCDKASMLKLVTADIIKNGRHPREYKLDELSRSGKLVYMGIALKINDLYHRHYLFDPHSCKIVKQWVDQ
jgi:hypothetical protein